MEDVYKHLPVEYQEQIADLLEEEKITSIKDYVRNLIKSDIVVRFPNVEETTTAE